MITTVNLSNDVKLDFSDVLMVPQNSDIASRSMVELAPDGYVPIMAANMDGVGTFEMAIALSKHKMLTALVKHYDLSDLVDFYTENQDTNISEFTAYSLGIGTKDFEKFIDFDMTLNDNGINTPKYLCVDVANGYQSQFLDFVSHMAEKYPQYFLIAGNVVTPKRTEELIKAGADIVKIGIGPGSVCTTRTMTGVGYPQFSAVLECSAAAKAAGGMIISDGGCTCPGDIAKAFGAGANMVMLGGMLAGHDEGADGGGAGTIIDGQKVVSFWGMASKTAQGLHNGGVANYRSSEGKTAFVPYRGKVEDTVNHILGGLRSTCAYINADNINEIAHQAEFVRVNNQVNKVFG